MRVWKKLKLETEAAEEHFGITDEVLPETLTKLGKTYKKRNGYSKKSSIRNKLKWNYKKEIKSEEETQIMIIANMVKKDLEIEITM